MHKSSDSFGEVFFALCKQVDTPTSLGCWLRYKHAEFTQLAKCRINPRDYTNEHEFAKDYLIVSYVSKYKGLNTGIDTRAVALQSFIDSELKCAQTNRNIRSWRAGLSKGPDAVLFTAARKIRDLLGPFSVFALEAGVGFGPGATNDLRRREALLDTKLTRVPLSVTRRCVGLAASFIENDLHWSSCVLNVPVHDILGPFSLIRKAVFDITDFGVLDTVPKNAMTDRVILKEPRLNAFVQKGFGAYLRKKLKSVGIDLNSQEFNQEAAFRCITDRLVTLDLKAASDTISRELIYELLPVDWAIALDECRSGFAKTPSGGLVKLEKFSSMGNGFTFELETLAFWAIVKAVCEIAGSQSEVLIYGDDIICSCDVSQEVVNNLELLGFTINLEKSYVSGLFYESCGKHYFNGIEVTPIYQKEVLLSESSHIRAHNRLRRYRDRANLWGLSGLTENAFNHLWRNRPSRVRACTIPFFAEGDDAFLVDYDDLVPSKICINRGLQVQTVTLLNRSLPADDRAFLALRLRARYFGYQHPSYLDLIHDPGMSLLEPYLGCIEIPLGETRARIGTRWIGHL